MKSLFLTTLILLVGCTVTITPLGETTEDDKVVEPVMETISGQPISGTPDYLYLTTLRGHPLLPPPVFEIPADPDLHTRYNGAYDSYAASLLDYRAYLTDHLVTLAKGAPSLDEDLAFRISCVQYVEEVLEVPEPPSIDELRAASGRSNDALRLAMSVYIQQQREYIAVLAGALRRYRQIRSRCSL